MSTHSPGPTPTPDAVEAPLTARCEVHGLHYPVSGAGQGCVLCRRGAQSPASATQRPVQGRARTIVVVAVTLGVLGAGAAGARLALREPNALQIGALGEVAENDDFVDCVSTCAQTNEQCVPQCPAGDSADACAASCLGANGECGLRCALEHHGNLERTAFTYAHGPMPAWDEVLLALQPAFAEVRTCVAKAEPITQIRVAVAAAGGTPRAVAVAAKRDDLELEACTRTALAQSSLPSAARPYAFVAVLDPREDLLDRAVRFANLEFELAREDGDQRALQTAQKKVWVLRTRVQERMRVEREEAKKRAEQAARAAQHASESQLSPYYPGQYRAPSRPINASGRVRAPDYRSSSSYQNSRTEYEVERMRAQRMREERVQEQRKQEEIRRLDRQAQMQQLEKIGW